MIKLINKIKKKGLISSLKIFYNAIDGRLFDVIHNSDTHQRILLSNLNIKEESKEHGINYDPSPIRPFLKLIRILKPTNTDVFIDIGSGKGRTLMLASNFNFKTIRGVEFSKFLCDTAINNIHNYSNCKTVSKIEVLNIDALKHNFTDETFIFLFNPFDQEIMKIVISNIVNSYHINHRNIYLIYNNPVHKLLIKQYNFFTKSTSYSLGGREFHVFQKLKDE